MTIREVARQADVNPRTLHYYERIGLLTPTSHTDAGYRLYPQRDAERLAFIRRALREDLTRRAARASAENLERTLMGLVVDHLAARHGI